MTQALANSERWNNFAEAAAINNTLKSSGAYGSSDQFQRALSGGGLDYDSQTARYGSLTGWWPGYGYPIHYPTTTPHRLCSCPNCKGDCCDCADCKVKRLEKRVAELEKERA